MEGGGQLLQIQPLLFMKTISGHLLVQITTNELRMSIGITPSGWGTYKRWVNNSPSVLIPKISRLLTPVFLYASII